MFDLTESIKKDLSSHDAREILNTHGGEDADFHQLSSDHVQGLLTHAKKVGYQKGSHAPGSRARMFHQALKRHAAKIHETVEEVGIVFEGDSVNERRESEYTANRHLASTVATARKPGHYLMKHGSPMHKEPHTSSQAALTAYKALPNSTGVSIHHVKEDLNEIPGAVKKLNELKKSTLKLKEDAPAMSSGGAGDPGRVQNATDNYASQINNRKKYIKNMVRRKKPVGESVLDGHVPPEMCDVTVGVVSPEELEKHKREARLPRKVGPGGIDQ